MFDELKAQTVAFAAICQASAEIQDLARLNRYDYESSRVMIKSLSIDSPETTEDIYPVDCMRKGLKAFVSNFCEKIANNNQSLEFIKYVDNFISFEKQLQKHPEILHKLFNKLNETKNYARENKLQVLNEDLLQKLSDIYVTEISNHSEIRKLVIYGNKSYLMQNTVQIKIRSLILAALRAVILWRQLGGRRTSLFFKRKKMHAFALSMLKSC